MLQQRWSPSTPYPCTPQHSVTAHMHARKAGAILQNATLQPIFCLWLIFSHAFGNQLRLFQGVRFSLQKKKKKNDDVQNCNVSYDSSVCQMGFQQNQRSFLAAHRASCFAICWWPPASRFLCFSLLFLWNSSKSGNWNPQMDCIITRTLPSVLTLPSGKTSPCSTMRALVLSCSLDQSWMVLSLSATLSAWKAWLRLRSVSSFSTLEPRGGRGWMIHLPTFPCGECRSTTSHKSEKAQSLCSCLVYLDFSTFSWRELKLKIFYFGFKKKFHGFAEMERKEKKKILQTKPDIWSQMAWT